MRGELKIIECEVDEEGEEEERAKRVGGVGKDQLRGEEDLQVKSAEV